jgi:hypothetical protein
MMVDPISFMCGVAFTITLTAPGSSRGLSWAAALLAGALALSAAGRLGGLF